MSYFGCFLGVDSGWVFVFASVRLILYLLFLFWFLCPCGELGVGGCDFGFEGGGGVWTVRLHEMFSLVPVPEIHWLLSDLLAFPDIDDTFLSFCLQLQDSFSQVLFPSRVSSHGTVEFRLSGARYTGYPDSTALF